MTEIKTCENCTDSSPTLCIHDYNPIGDNVVSFEELKKSQGLNQANEYWAIAKALHFVIKDVDGIYRWDEGRKVPVGEAFNLYCRNCISALDYAKFTIPGHSLQYTSDHLMSEPMTGKLPMFEILKDLGFRYDYKELYSEYASGIPEE